MAVARETIERLLACGAQAPSGDNLQPWTVHVDGDVIHLSVDPSRDRSLYNFKRRASLIALGAMIENITIAGREHGVNVMAEIADTPGELAVATLRLSPAAVVHDPLFPAIAKRCTNRKPYRREPLPGSALAAIQAAVPRGSGATLTLIRDPKAMRAVARGASLNDRLLFEWRALHDGFFESVRWTEAEAAETRDGLYVKTLELGPIEWSFKVSRSWAFLRWANLAGASRTAPVHSFQTFMRSSAFAYIQAARSGPRACIEGGRLAQRLWLTATSLGLAAQPMTGMLCLLPYVRESVDSGISSSGKALVSQAHELFKAHLPLAAGEQPILLIRMGLGAPPSALSLRREVPIKGDARLG